ncbi:hypothetical protein N7451_005324 [Penicillium sp. IBT 35674x]|nr:hypothetical protein N7451_005324 [Penicillium sp. IBT 35674x]
MMEVSSKTRIRRARSGCWNCKKDKPSCKGCLKRGQQCHYGIRLLWKDEAQAMGIVFGRSGMKDRFTKQNIESTASHYLLPTNFHTARYWLTTTSEDVRLLYEGYPDSREAIGLMNPRPTGAGSLVQSDTIPLILSQHPSLEEADNFLFHYYSENPWRSVLLPMCFQSDGLLHIAIAWAAHSLRNQCEDRDVCRYDQMILTHKCRSLKYLRGMLPQGYSDQSGSSARTRCERDSLLLLMMFHCLLEIASGSVVEWTYHMKGAFKIMKFYMNSCSSIPRREIFSQEVLELVYTFFIEKNTFLSTSTTISGIEEEKYLDGLHGSTELHSTAFEEATWIYLHHAINDEPYQSDIIQSVHLPRIIDALEQIHQAQGALLCFIPYPMWPLFIASCVVQEEGRVKILEFFTVLKQKKPISNVPSTMSAVEAIWKSRDLSADGTSEEPSRHAATWTHVISQLGWMMPFT